MKKLSYFTPPLVAIFTVTSLYTANAARLEWSDVAVSLVLSLLVAGLFMLLFWLLRWTAKDMPFVASVFTAAALLWYMITPYGGLVLVTGALLLVIWRKVNTQSFSAFLSLIMLFAIVVSSAWATQVNISNQASSQAKTTIGEATPGTPNIYFIVPDRMPSFDAMRESHIECETFLQELLDRGFYVKENQLSHDEFTADYDGEIHTTRTMRYMASVLNDGAEIPLDISYKDCREMIKVNSLFGKLHEKGYTVYNVASWFTETGQLPGADFNYNFTDVTLLDKFYQNEFSVAYISRTILKGINFKMLQSEDSLSRVEKTRHIWQRNTVYRISLAHGGPWFVMAHLMLPHEPFVWCDMKTSQPEQYYQQIKYTQTYLITLIGEIQVADPDGIIIIQSDEGMAYKKPIELNYTLSPVQWNGVLTAWYIPGADEVELSKLKHTEILKYVTGND